MPSMSTIAAFAMATLAMLVVPGPSVVYLVSRSVALGRAAGLVAMLGVETGALAHASLTASGLGALLASTPWALTVMRCVGAGYLVMLGARQLKGSKVRVEAGSVSPQIALPVPVLRSPVRLFRDGVMVDLLNPKTMLFFLAFLPQFVVPARGPAGGQLVVLGLCFVALALFVDGGYVVLAASMGGRIGGARRPWADRLTGVVYLGIAGAVAFA